MENSTEQQKHIDNYESKIIEALRKIQDLPSDVIKSIDGIKNIGDYKSFHMKNEDFEIYFGKTDFSNQNFFEHKVELKDGNGDIIFQKTTCYDIHIGDTEITNSLVDNWEKEVDTVITKINDLVITHLKENTINKIKDKRLIQTSSYSIKPN